MRADVQKNVANFNSNASGAVQVKLSVGVGVAIEGKIGTAGGKYEIAGPQASVTTSLGETKAEATLASVTMSKEIGKASAESSLKVGVFELKNGSLSMEPVKLENKLGPDDISKKVGDKQASEALSVSSSEMTLGAKLGAFGVTVKADLVKAKDAVSDWVGAVGSYFKALGQQANNTFFGGQGKSQ